MRSLPVLGDINARRTMRLVAPRTANQLHAWVRLMLGFDLPRQPLIAGHDAPFDYLAHSFFEDSPVRDCVVWANRGGGKTQIGAIATLLDLLFKPGIQIRVLGGSFEQSSKMHGYLARMLHNNAFEDLIAGKLTSRHVELFNGSRVEILSQSERAVRGMRVHKVRCDEVELFDPDIWEAAQLATRSGRCGTIHVRGAIEALSTMHRSHGLMRRLIDENDARRGVSPRRIFRWSMLDTLAWCEPARLCNECTLWEECQGRAKAARGFIAIDDAVQQKARVGDQVWASEMLCERPDRSHAVYPEFDPAVHVFDESIETFGDSPSLLGGIDFGYRAPTVVLWALLDHDRDVVRVVEEFVVTEHIVSRVIDQARKRSHDTFGRLPKWMGVDPAGHQRNDQSGISAIGLWKRAGWTVRSRMLAVEAGVAAVRARLKRADGSIGLRFHKRCTRLIESLLAYHYRPDEPESLDPVKDGPDHAADALRYLIVNLDRESWGVEAREY